MTNELIKPSTASPLLPNEIVVVRQPIFDRRKEVFAYELLFKSGFKGHFGAITHRPEKESDSIKAVDTMLVNGLKRLTNGKKAVIHFNRKMILNKLPLIFPCDLLGVELTEEPNAAPIIESNKKIVQAVRKLKEDGYLVIVNDLYFNQGDVAVVRMADIVGVDFRSPGLSKRFSIFEDDPARPRFLARSVETASDFDTAASLGYQFFQGDFFNSVDMISVRSIPGYKINLMRILKEINKPKVEFNKIEEILKKDVSLTYKLLRFINSAAFYFQAPVQSIVQALMLLGEIEVRKWLSLIVLSSVGTDKPQELVQSTVVRAKFCESIAQELKQMKTSLPIDVSNCFLLGMFSKVDVFLGRPMVEILRDLPLDNTVKAALLGVENPYRDILLLVTDYENGDWENLEQKIKLLGLDTQIVANLYLDAVEWGRLF